ncbi:MAG TPA: RDD family protein [Vicinamibacterales bacterium]|jgi:uncharacterized RDD family membrane protein YckC
MKCPKCSYLGFETGDRCKNCGYDFSLLISNTSPIEAELSMREPEGREAPDIWLDRIDTGVKDIAVATRTAPEPAAAGSSVSTAVAVSAPAAQPRDLSFPLFAPERDEDDEPLIKLPSSPRPPLAVRRTPEQPRLRPSARLLPHEESRLELDTSEPITPTPDIDEFRSAPERSAVMAPVVSGLTRRAAAGLIDLAILLGIDFVIVYSTLQMSSLTLADWALLPVAPMLAFLGLLKLSYFGAFTAACGQTIGKMAMRIRVIADDATLDPARAARRTLVSAVSLLAVGTGYIPVLVDPDRRALHDRLAGTRVVTL